MNETTTPPTRAPLIELAQETAYTTIVLTVLIDLLHARAPERHAELRARLLPVLKKLASDDPPVGRAHSALTLLLQSLNATMKDLGANDEQR